MKSFLARRIYATRRNAEWFLMNQNRKRWFVYIVKCSDGTLYTGVTTDIDRRLHEHNFTKKGAKYTMSRRPVALVACKLIKEKSDAFKLEYKVKQKKKSDKINFLMESKDESI